MEQLIQLLKQKFANNDDSVNAQIADQVETILNSKPEIVRSIIYQELCKTATHIAWDNGKCIGMAIIMLPTKDATNSVAFKGKQSVVLADRELIAESQTVLESVTWSGYNIKNTEINLMTTPSYSGLSSTNNIIRVDISNKVFCSFHNIPASDYLMLTVTPDESYQNSFYEYCANSWQS